MSILDRYVLREIVVPFGVGLGLFFVVVAFGQVLKVSDSITGLGVTGSEVWQALMYSFPPLLGLLIPVSTLFSTLLGIGRLAADKEVIGLCAGGVSPYRLLRVPFVVGVMLALVAGVVTGFGEAWGVRGLRQLMAQSAQRTLAQGIEPGEFYEWLPGITFIADMRQADNLLNVVFADLRDPDQPVVVSSKSAVVQRGDSIGDIVFELKNGTILTVDAMGNTHQIFRFDTSQYLLDVTSLVGNKAKTLMPVQEKSIRQLWKDSSTTNNINDRALLLITLHRKFSIPLAALIFSLLAVPLACRSNSTARARGFLYSCGIVGAYYYVGRAAELSARSGGLNAVLAAWLPNLIGLVGMLILLMRFRRSAA
jgi:lipopolysaccharide export system permease protein